MLMTLNHGSMDDGGEGEPLRVWDLGRVDYTGEHKLVEASKELTNRIDALVKGVGYTALPALPQPELPHFN